MKGPKVLLLPILLVEILVLSLSGCAAAKMEIKKVAADLAPVIAGAEKLMGNIQANYDFYALLAQGAGQLVGVKVTPDMVALGKQVAQIADDGLKIAGPIDAAVQSGQSPQLDVAQTQKAIADVAAAFPEATAKAMQNPGVAALYQVYLAQKAVGTAPVPAPAAVPTS